MDYEENVYFLGLTANHPNLYHQKHEFYKDPIMRKGSWGQIGLSMCITGQEVEAKWLKMCKFYKEEAALRNLEELNDVEIVADEKSSHHLLYNRLHKILHMPKKTVRCKDINRHRGPTDKNVPRKRLMKCTTKAKEASHQLRQHLIKSVKENGTSVNEKIGKLLAAEMLLKSPRSRALIMRKIFQCKTQQDGFITENETDDD